MPEFVLTNPDDINAFRLLSLKGRMSLELEGFKSQLNTFAAVRREFGYKGTRQQVYDQYCAMLLEKGILKEPND